ncbi:MAG: alpha/beta fold hydrolase [Actinobacteria bacterium]|nr:alpha/beta fold hydrolase [Actinomycetota bacterium]
MAGVPTDRTITSFDGTKIRAHWFPLAGATRAKPAPTVLMGPGWGSPGDTNTSSAGVFGALNIDSLRKAGFNVLTWDPRGFGASGGTAEVDSKDFEGRDVQVLLDWVAAQPGVQLDRAGDPRAGMVGGSYGGGIQLVVAAIDCRVDAIVPIVAWNSLGTSLAKARTPKIGWSNILVRVAAGRPVDPRTVRANRTANERGVIDPADERWFLDRGPGALVSKITAPTLLVSGTVDTLFTLDEAITNYRILRGNGVPTAMVWFCGGHGTCLTSAGDLGRVPQASIAWLQRWVQGRTSVATPAPFEFVDQNGSRYTSSAYPLPEAAPLTGSGSGTLRLVAEGGAGPAVPPPSNKPDLLRGLVLAVTPSKAANAVDVPIDVAGRAALVVGAPEVELRYRGTVPAGERPTRVFAQLVDEATGLALGNQITPIALTLDGAARTAKVPLEAVSYAVRPGTRLALQLVATTTAYVQPRLGGTVTFASVKVRLPVAKGITPAGP